MIQPYDIVAVSILKYSESVRILLWFLTIFLKSQNLTVKSAVLIYFYRNFYQIPYGEILVTTAAVF